jgi:hypothetical protein
MFLVHKKASNSPRAGVEVLVVAPGGHVHSPVMEVELNVTSSMGQVKTNIATLREGGGGEKEGRREGDRESGHINLKTGIKKIELFIL